MRKEDIFPKNNESSFLILTDGKILNINDGKTNFLILTKHKLIYLNIHQKLPRHQKFKEVDTKKLFNCLIKEKINLNYENKVNESLIFNCDKSLALKNKISQELFSRFFKPFYIPLLALIEVYY